MTGKSEERVSVPVESNLLRTDLIRIVQDIFLAMLSMEVGESGLAVEAPDGAVVTASLHLSGTWNGAILLQCDLETACQFAEVMLGIQRPAAADEDVKDVMGELINMVAGNFKAVLGGGSRLSLPTVVEGSDYRFHLLRGTPAARLDLITPAGAVRVSLVEISAQEQAGGLDPDDTSCRGR